MRGPGRTVRAHAWALRRPRAGARHVRRPGSACSAQGRLAVRCGRSAARLCVRLPLVRDMAL
jgi:hypothetical protein